jgi:hypothetical protein
MVKQSEIFSRLPVFLISGMQERPDRGGGRPDYWVGSGGAEEFDAGSAGGSAEASGAEGARGFPALDPSNVWMRVMSCRARAKSSGVVVRQADGYVSAWLRNELR